MAGATEVCMQGGIHPDLPGSFYFDLLDAIRARTPDHPHPRVQPDGGPERRHEAGHLLPGVPPGMPASRPRDHPGHRGRDPRRRRPLAAHEGQAPGRHVGGDRPHRTRSGYPKQLDHHVRPRRRPAPLGRAHPSPGDAIQQDTGGFTEFVPLPVRPPERAHLPGGQGAARARRSRRACGCTRWRASCSTAWIPNVQVSWVKLGVEACQAILQAGANDFGGTLDGGDDQPHGGRGLGDPDDAGSVRRRDPRDRSRPIGPHDDVRARRDPAETVNLPDRYGQAELDHHISSSEHLHTTHRPDTMACRSNGQTMKRDARQGTFSD